MTVGVSTPVHMVHDRLWKALDSHDSCSMCIWCIGYVFLWLVCDLLAFNSQTARRRDAHNASHVNIAFLPSRNNIAEDVTISATAPFAFHKIK